MALLGESFKPYVKDQINKRQEKLSSFNKDNDLLKYLTSNTAFIRLTSGVNVGEDILKSYNLPSHLANNNLASRFILEAARFSPRDLFTDDNKFPEKKLTSGVGYKTQIASAIEDDFNTYTSYGFLSDSTYGYVPPPGITQISVKTLNRGTLREATIQLICHNKQQFNVINILFLKLKYSLLLEWGHTIYYDKNGNLVEGFDVSNLSSEFLTGGLTQTKLLAEIEGQRDKSGGNYDAFFGWIKNFQWEIQENGSYNIMVNAISTGDVIESIKLNANYNPNAKVNKDVQDTPENKYEKSTLHQILGAIRKNPTLTTRYYLDGFKTDDNNALNSLALSALTGKPINWHDPEDNNKVASEGNSILAEKEAIRVDFPKLQVTQNKQGKNVQNSQYYLKLGALLRIIETFLLFYNTSTSESLPSPEGFETAIDKKMKEENITFKQAFNALLKNNNSNSSNVPPIFHISHNYDTNECLTTVNQLPADPRVALIPIAGENANTGPMKYVSSKYRTERSYIAKTMHIYVNIDYIITTLDNNVDSDGNITILDFLKSLLNGISSALGCINKFEISYDDAINTFSIVDSALVPIKYQVEGQDVAVFNINTFTPDNPYGGSFVTNFGLKSDIYSSIANAAALSAQGGSDASSTAFSGFNTGITDRYLTSKGNKIGEMLSTSSIDSWEVTKTKFTEFAKKLTSSTPSTALTPEDIDLYTSYVVDVLQKDLDSAVKTDQIVGTVFIPLNLNLTINGLSGMRQYQTFRISENVLPQEYYDRIKFITTVIEHKVDTKGWETTINTIGMPRKPKAVYNDNPLRLITS